jgi:hypothetical protein
MAMGAAAPAFRHGVALPPNDFASVQEPLIGKGDYNPIWKGQQVSVLKPFRIRVNECLPLCPWLHIRGVVIGQSVFVCA